MAGRCYKQDNSWIGLMRRRAAVGVESTVAMAATTGPSRTTAVTAPLPEASSPQEFANYMALRAWT